MNLEDYTFNYPNPNDVNFTKETAKLEEYRNAESLNDQNLRLLYHQELTKRYMSPETLNDRLFIYGKPGTGKTCQILGTIVSNMKLMPHLYTKSPWIIAPAAVLDSFRENLIKCVPAYSNASLSEHELLMEELEEIDEDNKKKRIRRPWNNKMINRDFNIDSHDSFISAIKGLDTARMKNLASNRIIVLDESHLLRKKNSAANGAVTVELDPTVLPEDTYDIIHKFFHAGENNMIIISTGTPAVGSGKEVWDGLNLILALNKQIDENSSVAEIKQKCKGLVSFVNRPYDPQRELKFMGETHTFTVDDTVLTDTLYKIPPSPEQMQIISTIMENTGRQGVYTDEIAASIFAGDWDEFKKEISKIKETDKVKENEKRLLVLRKYSGKLYVIVEYLLNPKNKNKKVFIYSNYVDNGVRRASDVLKLFGFGEFGLPTNITSRNLESLLPNPNFGKSIVMTGDNNNNDKLRDLFNMKQNWNGASLRIVLGSPVTNAGISFLDTTVMFFLDSEWRPAYNEQARSRIDRYGGLTNYLQQGGFGGTKITQEIYQLVLDFPKSVDYKLYEKAKAIDVLDISPKLLILQEIAFDCIFLRNINIWPSIYDNTIFCNYSACNYACDGISSGEYDTLIPSRSNYRALYRNIVVEKTTPIFIQLFNQYNFLSLNDILFILGSSPFNFKNIDMDLIIYTLNILITNQTLFYNKYGFICTLTCDNNLYFLIQNFAGGSGGANCNSSKSDAQGVTQGVAQGVANNNTQGVANRDSFCELFSKSLDFASNFYTENIICNNLSNATSLNSFLNENNINTDTSANDGNSVLSLLVNIKDKNSLIFQINAFTRETIAEIVEYLLLNPTGAASATIVWYTEIMDIFAKSNIYKDDKLGVFHNILINTYRVLTPNTKAFITVPNTDKIYKNVIVQKNKNDIDYFYNKGFSIIGRIDILNNNDFFIIDKSFDNPDIRTNKIATTSGRQNFNNEQLTYIIMFMISDLHYVPNGILGANFPEELNPHNFTTKVVPPTSENIKILKTAIEKEEGKYQTKLIIELFEKSSQKPIKEVLTREVLTKEEELYLEYYLLWHNTSINKQTMLDNISKFLQKIGVMVYS